MLHDLQRAFRQGLLAGDESAALAAIRSDHLTPAERFEIYRNNVFGSLFDVLSAAFPVTRKLAGFDAFRRAAASFIAKEPPTRPHLASYGDRFPALLPSLAFFSQRPALVEMAQLEWARIEALFAADADPLAAAALGAIAPDALAEIKLTLHPSARLLALQWPLHDLWHQAQSEGAALSLPKQAAKEKVLVLRPHWQVLQLRLSAGDHAFLLALYEKKTLGEAAQAALGAEPSLDLQALLFAHLNRGTFAAIEGNPS